MNVQIKILDSRVGHGAIPLPTYATPGSACIDLRALEDYELECSYLDYDSDDDEYCLTSAWLERAESLKVRTGISIYIKDPGVCGIVAPRSGLGSKGIILGNSIGVFDSSYTGEVLISMYNRSGRIFKIKAGDRIAQMMFVPIIQPEFTLVAEFDSTTERGEGGFGSTGVK